MIIGISGKIGSGKDTVGNIINWLIWKEKFHPKDDSVKYYSTWYRKESDNCGFEIKKFAFKLKQVVSLLTGCTVDQLEDQEFKKKELGEEWNWFLGIEATQEDGIVKMRLNPTEEAKRTLPFPNRIKPYTYREMLQRVGTEAMRHKIHENVWVNALFADYKCHDKKLEFKCKCGWKGDSETVGGGGQIADTGDYDDPQCPKCYTTLEGEDLYPNWIITDVRFPNELKAIEERKGITLRISRPQFFRQQDLENPEYVAKHNHPSETSLDEAKFDYVINNDGSIEELIEKVRTFLKEVKIL